MKHNEFSFCIKNMVTSCYTWSETTTGHCMVSEDITVAMVLEDNVCANVLSVQMSADLSKPYLYRLISNLISSYVATSQIVL